MIVGRFFLKGEMHGVLISFSFSYLLSMFFQIIQQLNILYVSRKFTNWEKNHKTYVLPLSYLLCIIRNNPSLSVYPPPYVLLFPVDVHVLFFFHFIHPVTM